MFKKFQSFKRRWLEEQAGAGEGGSGGGSGAGGSGAGGGDGAAPPVKPADGAGSGNNGSEPPVDHKAEYEKLKAEHDKATGELTKFQNFHAQASQFVDVDEQGNIKPKPAKSDEPPSPEELDRQRMAEDITNRAVTLSEQNRKAQEKIINEFKAKDPLFATNWLKAQEKIETVPASQRSEAVWRRAYAMAAGENMEPALKAAREQGKREAAEDFTRQHGASFEGSTGAGSDKSGAPDLTKIVLTREQVREANRMIEAGLIDKIDTYKENMVYLGQQEGE